MHVYIINFNDVSSLNWLGLQNQHTELVVQDYLIISRNFNIKIIQKQFLRFFQFFIYYFNIKNSLFLVKCKHLILLTVILRSSINKILFNVQSCNP